MSSTTYLDYASLFPPVPEALDAMWSAAGRAWGQPGLLYTVGGRALYALDTARRQVADDLGTVPKEIVFTSSGRHALEIAMPQALGRVPASGKVVSSRLEHPSVQELVEGGGTDGYEVEWLALPEGSPNAEDVRSLESASLVVLSTVNHELGTSLLEAFAEVPESTVRVVDAVQAAPSLSLGTLNDERTFYAVSGAKLGAPMGIGAVRVPSKSYFAARRSGKPIEGESPPWITAIGLGAACEAREKHRDESLRVARARADELLAGLRSLEPELITNGSLEVRVGPVLNLSSPGQYGKSMVAALSLEAVCISHTAACQARRTEVSPVVRAAYPEDPQLPVGATRWSVSKRVTEEDIARALEDAKRIMSHPGSAR